MNTVRIHVEGHVDSTWLEWLGLAQIDHLADNTSLLIGPVADQAALYGYLTKLRDGGVTLLGLEQVNSNQLDQGANIIMNQNNGVLLNTTMGTSLIGGPLLCLIYSLLFLSSGDTVMANVIYLLGLAFFAVAIAAIGLRLYQRAPGMTIIVGVLALFGILIGGGGWAFLGLFEAAAAAAGIEALSETILASAGASTVLSLFGLLMPAAFIIFAIGLQRAQQQPMWITGLQILGMVLFIASWFTPPLVAVIAFLALLVGYGWLGLRFFTATEQIGEFAITS
jgi:hypothetical protein